MKIQNTTGQVQIAGRTSPLSQAAGSSDFQQMLAARLAAAGESASLAGPAKTTAIPAVVPASLRLASLDLTETTLDTLAAYGRALGETSLDAAGLEPFVAALEEETTGLLDLKAQLPADDPLAKLLDQVASVGFLESARFRRGDYQS